MNRLEESAAAVEGKCSVGRLNDNGSGLLTAVANMDTNKAAQWLSRQDRPSSWPWLWTALGEKVVVYSEGGTSLLAV